MLLEVLTLLSLHGEQRLSEAGLRVWGAYRALRGAMKNFPPN